MSFLSKGASRNGCFWSPNQEVFAKPHGALVHARVRIAPPLKRSPSLHTDGADRIQGIRCSPKGFFAHCTVQKVAMATPFAVERPDNESAWGELVARLACGDENALAELYDRTNRIVYGLALRILGDPSTAEDITMEVYLQVWRNAAHYNPQRGSVLSWLLILVRSRSIDSLRSSQGPSCGIRR
jgi:hypothetical protein